MVEGADLTAPGAFRVDLWAGYSNIFEQDSADAATLYLDMERLIATAAVRYGVAERLEIGARLTMETDWGGFMDGFVAGFHEALSLGNRNRRDFPSGAYGQTLEDGDGRVLVDVPRRSFDVVDVRAFAKWRAVATADGRRVLSLRAVARFPTAKSAVGAQSVDVSLMALGRTAWRGFHLHGMAGGSTVNRSPELRDVLRGYTAFAMAGVERPLNARLSAVVEFTGSTPILRSFGDGDVDGAPTNLVFGVVGRTAGGWRWQVGMQEDVPPWGPSLDFTVQLGLSRTF